MTFRRLVVSAGALCAFVMLASCASEAQETTLPDSAVTPGETAVEQGRAIVEANCTTCHAVGESGDSPHPDAPPFRTLSQNYPIESLSEAFAEGILVGHPDMPEFRLEPAQINAVLAYIQSVQEQPAQAPTTPAPTQSPQ